jgi:hypothetical protein
VVFYNRAIPRGIIKIRAGKTAPNTVYQKKGERMGRSLNVIAADIQNDWQKVNIAALPYLEAMHSLITVNDRFGLDSGDSIVRYFLSNSTTWRGPVARSIKAELKALIN